MDSHNSFYVVHGLPYTFRKSELSQSLNEIKFSLVVPTRMLKMGVGSEKNLYKIKYKV